MRKSEIIIVGIILLSFMTGILIYPQTPERMASHWNMHGQVDGYMSKPWALFLMPLLSLILFLLFLLIPKIDPLKENIEKFRGYFDIFVVLVILFLFYLYVLTLLQNRGMRFNMVQFLVPAFGILFYYTGILVEHAKRNWFIGIRTPWTLSSERVWGKTHSRGGKLFKGSGVIVLLGILFPDYALPLILVPVIFTAGYAIVYSYLEYQKEEKQSHAN